MSLPKPGSRWSRSGEILIVSAADGRRILLVNEETGASSEIQPWQWPGDLVPSSGGSAGEPSAERRGSPIVAALVGGAAGSHFDRLWEQAADLGVELLYHYPADVTRPPKRLPTEVKLVVFLTSHLSHSIYTPMKATAKAAGIPIANARSQGFANDLSSELSKLGISTFGSRFGGDLAEEPVHYRWDGKTYVAEGPSSEEGIGTSLVLAGGLATVGGLLFGPAGIVTGGALGMLISIL